MSIDSIDFIFTVQRKGQTTTVVIKLPLEILTTPTRALSIMCVWAAMCLITRPKVTFRAGKIITTLNRHMHRADPAYCKVKENTKLSGSFSVWLR